MACIGCKHIGYKVGLPTHPGLCLTPNRVFPGLGSCMHKVGSVLCMWGWHSDARSVTTSPGPSFPFLTMPLALILSCMGWFIPPDPNVQKSIGISGRECAACKPQQAGRASSEPAQEKKGRELDRREGNNLFETQQDAIKIIKEKPARGFITGKGRI